MARVLIAGCGYVGSALGTRLAASGHLVWGMRRTAGYVGSGVRSIAADLTRRSSLKNLPGPFDHVFYTASAGGTDDAAYRRAYVEGLENLIAALETATAPPRRMFFTSSTSVYGQRSGEWIDETSETVPTHFTGRRVLEGERLLQAGPFPATVIRLGGIYGPGRAGLIERVRGGRCSFPEEPPLYTNRIHRDDAAGALEHLMALDAPEALYLGVDHEPAPIQEIRRWIEERLGRAPTREGHGSPPASRRARSSKRCSNARLVATGYRFVYPSFREGYRELIRPGRDAAEDA